MNQLVSQLNQIYYEEEWWIKEKISLEEITRYHNTVLEQGNLITQTDGDILCGYVEFWRINFEQFGRIICGERFSPLDQDVWSGYIAYVANTFIRPEYRNGVTYRMLRNRFFEVNAGCTYFVGNARRKKSELVKVFKVDKIMLHKEMLNGKL